MSLLNSLEIEEITVKNRSPNTASFIFRHLPTTMGVTIGNYLKRLLSFCVSGLAPVAVVIADKNGPRSNEFTTLEGVLETTVYLILNLKKIILEEKKLKEEIFCLEIKVENKTKEEQIVTAGDFQQKSKEVQIKNPELYLATIAPGGILEIKLYCRKGLGYHKASVQQNYGWWKKKFGDEENIIALDTDYSPVKSGYEGDQVNFKVKTIVVSLSKKEEELELTVATNGAVKPKDALLEVLQMSQNLCGKIVGSVNGKKKEIAIEE